MNKFKFKYSNIFFIILLCIISILFSGDKINRSFDNKDDSYEDIRIMVELNGQAAIDMKSSDDNNKLNEERVLDAQHNIINKVSDITGNEVKNRFAYLVNGFSITGKSSDIDKIKKIDGVKNAYESKKLLCLDVDKESDEDIASNIVSKYNYTGKGTVISIIDTGMDVNNENMKDIDKSNLKLTKDEVSETINKIGRGTYISDKIPFAYNYADGDLNIINTSEIHGMHVTGIAAANGEKFSGVAKDAQILAMKVKSNAGGGFYSEDLLLAIEDSVKLNADIINMSYGSDASVKSDDSLYKKAIEKAAESGILCVNSAGNSGVSTTNDKNSYPSNYSNIKDTSIVDNCSLVTLTVASMNKYNEMSNFSSWGPSADLELKPEITALGENVRSTSYDNEYAVLSGTSMSAPYVSGSEAIIYQYINNNFKNIPIQNKVQFAKNLAMNTADILYENDIPYSPRRQGAGAINIQKAIKNTVIATDDSGKASLALKNITGQKDFNIVVTNYGQKDVSFKLNDKEKLYSEIVLDNKEIKEVEISGSEITFDKSSILVKGGSSEIIKAKVTIPDNFEKNNFVEGFVRLNSQSDTNPSLNIPLIAFYGDYGDETILDYPIYDNRSLFKVTGLGRRSGGTFNYYGEYTDENGDKKVDSNLVAFSPNNDGNQDGISLFTYFLRNAKYYEIEVLDDKKNFIGNKVTYNNVTKNIYYDSSGNNDKQIQYYYNWDGTKYNMATGNSEVVDDGLYYVRAKTVGYTENAKEQIIDMPVKIDTTAPVIDDINVIRNGDDDNVTYTLRWEARDNYSGVKSEAEYFLNDNENTSCKLNNIKVQGNVYTSDIILNKGQINKITLKVYDYAGNEKRIDFTYNAEGDKGKEPADDTPEKPKMVDALSFSKLKDGLVINVGSGKFKIKGYVRDDVDSVYINDTEATVSDGNLQSTVILNDGNNNVHAVAKDKDGNIIFDKNYNVILDKDPPKFISVSPDSTKRVYVTESDTYDMSIKVSDISTVKCIVTNELTSQDTDGKLNQNGEGTVNVPLEMGLNKLRVELSDEASNYAETFELLVVKVSDVNELNVGFVNIENSESSAGDVDDDGFINVIGYVTKIPKVFKINDNDVQVKDDYTVSQKVKLEEGLNKVKIYAEDENGKVVEEYAYRLYYDSKAPQINLDIPIKNFSDNTFYTNNQNFILKGYIEDDKSDYKVYLNGNMIINTQTGIVGSCDDSLKRNFKYKCILFPGDNYFKFRTVDKFGNDKTQVVKVVCVPPLDVAALPGGSVEVLDDKDASGTPSNNSPTSDQEKVEFFTIIIAFSIVNLLRNYKQKHT